MIYFIGNIEHDIVKIGYTSDLNKRIKQLLTSCPYELTVFKTIEGDLCYEKQLHNYYKEYNINREWFKLSNIDINNIPAPVKEIVILTKKGVYVDSIILNYLFDTEHFKDLININNMIDYDITEIYTAILDLFNNSILYKTVTLDKEIYSLNKERVLYIDRTKYIDISTNKSMLNKYNMIFIDNKHYLAISNE